ncbi:MAG: arylsulfatase [Caulobacterales bacterium]|nr:arylsulfatase [Caulobacterales bacterium]
MTAATRLLGVCLLIGFVTAAGCAEGPRAPSPTAGGGGARPNILVILADDLGWGDVGFHGSAIRTPTLDRLAAEGVRLDRHYVYPVCSPTRAALLTGQSALALGVDGPMSDEAGLPLSAVLLPERLRDAGYQTYMVGKWHLGLHDTRYFPQARGFDQFYGHLGGFVEYFSHLYFDRLDWQRNGVSIEEEGHATDLLAKEAVRVLRGRDASRPFFLYLALSSPHTPLQPPAGYEARHADIADPLRADYARLVEAMDDAIGRVVAELDAQGLARDTLIVFMSDNGGNEREGGADNGPLRGGKGEPFEGGIRSPTVLAWPGVLERGRVYDAPISVHDWTPTLMTAAGLAPPDGERLAGVDHWAAIAGHEAPPRRDFAVGSRRGTAYVSWPWKLVAVSGGEGGPARTRLFDIARDPYEEDDLFAREPAIAARLAGELQALPRAPSLADAGPPVERLWRAPDGTLDYDLRRNMTSGGPPVAESAAREEGE